MVSSTEHRCLVQDENRRPIPYPRPRAGDGRWKDRTRTDPKPKCSHHISPSLYVPWTVARRPPMLREGSPLDGLRHPARRSRAPATRELAGLPANELARCELASSLARRSRTSQIASFKIARCELARSRARLLTAGGGNAGFFEGGKV
ncbi:UNVERIFIED_CONTAM: hypothetical protein Sradi_7135900 [Sesamum radiatum]|uniref:Uncharacterized protein n=1 Tax=Sesamum radiatum TaxID=300843 RepID=A0AAW2IXZ9_SESRA